MPNRASGPGMLAFLEFENGTLLSPKRDPKRASIQLPKGARFAPSTGAASSRSRPRSQFQEALIKLESRAQARPDGSASLRLKHRQRVRWTRFSMPPGFPPQADALVVEGECRIHHEATAQRFRPGLPACAEGCGGFRKVTAFREMAGTGFPAALSGVRGAGPTDCMRRTNATTRTLPDRRARTRGPVVIAAPQGRLAAVDRQRVRP